MVNAHPVKSLLQRGGISLQAGAAGPALPARRRSAPSGGRERHAVRERGGHFNF